MHATVFGAAPGALVAHAGELMLLAFTAITKPLLAPHVDAGHVEVMGALGFNVEPIAHHLLPFRSVCARAPSMNALRDQMRQLMGDGFAQHRLGIAL